ncbi:S-layer homology domain-containing protein [Pseudoneobacillus sp. C159]
MVQWWFLPKRGHLKLLILSFCYNRRVLDREVGQFTMKKKVFSLFLTTSLLISGLISQATTTSAAETPSKDPKIYSDAEVKTMLREVATENGIPPEILKAIAYVENGMKQYDAAGNPVLNPTDGGIGIMQITLSDEEATAKGIDKEALKWNTRYNIEIGAKILLEKFRNPNLPKVNDKNPEIIENWYFAIMAYNGLSKRNDPTLNPTTAYQETVIKAIRDKSLLPIGPTPKVDIRYPYPDKPDLMVFPEGDYRWTTKTKSTQMLAQGQTAYTLNNQLTYSRLRDSVNGAEIKQLPHYTPLEIVSGPYEVDKADNHYNMYEVNMNGVKGYLSSSNIQSADKLTIFKDVAIGEQASAVTYLQLKNLIANTPDGKFNPNKPILRREAATMLVKELGLTLPDGYKMKATDMKPTDANYEEMTIAEAHGILGKDGTIRPTGHLTRAQMAAILVRAYDKVYNQPTTSVSFTDVKKTDWSYNDINSLAFNKITVTAGGAYRPNGDVTKAQFALFLMRTIEMRK